MSLPLVVKFRPSSTKDWSHAVDTCRYNGSLNPAGTYSMRATRLLFKSQQRHRSGTLHLSDAAPHADGKQIYRHCNLLKHRLKPAVSKSPVATIIPIANKMPAGSKHVSCGNNPWHFQD